MRYLHFFLSPLIFVGALSGCRSAPSLTGAELVRKYPNKHYIQVDGVSLYYEQAGLGPPVVLLHGLLTHSALWRTITAGLTYGNSLYSVDLMGFGFSEKPQHVSYSLDAYVTQLHRLIEELRLYRPVLVGHGLGAAIAALYAVRYPTEVDKLVLLDAPFSQVASPFSLRLLQVPLFGSWFTGDWIIDRMLRGGVENSALLTDAVRQLYTQPYHDDPGAWTALQKCLRETEVETMWKQQIRPGLATLQSPILLVWGSNDEYVPIAVGRAVYDLLPRAQMEVILHSGHYIQEERPEEVRAVLKAFLTQE